METFPTKKKVPWICFLAGMDWSDYCFLDWMDGERERARERQREGERERGREREKALVW